MKISKNVWVGERTSRLINIEAKLMAINVEVEDIMKEFDMDQQGVGDYENAFGELLDIVRLLRDKSIMLGVNESKNDVIITI